MVSAYFSVTSPDGLPSFGLFKGKPQDPHPRGSRQYIPRDSLRQKFLPRIKKGAFLDLRHFFLICGVFFRIAAELVFSFFYPPICGGNRRECGGNRRECGGNRRECGGNSRKANGVAAFVFWLRCFFWFAADFLECGGNFRRNALRQKFLPQEVLGIYIYIYMSPYRVSH